MDGTAGLFEVILETQSLIQDIEKDLQEIQTKLSILKTKTSVAQTTNTLPHDKKEKVARDKKVCKSCKQKEGIVCCSMCKNFVCQTCSTWVRSNQSTSFLQLCEHCSFDHHIFNKHHC